MNILNDYAWVVTFGIVGILFVVASFVISWLIRPNHPTEEKESTYECGEQTIGSSWIQFNVRYYIFCLIFVIFDVEALFLFPWAVVFKQLSLFGFVEMMIFIIILVVGFIYAWGKADLEWK